MSEGREVLGYTLIRRRETSPLTVYWVQRGDWTSQPEGACCEASVSDLLAQAAKEDGLRWVQGSSYHIGRVVQIPGEQTVEQIQDPTEADAWGVRARTSRTNPWRSKTGTSASNPVPMLWDKAVEVRGVAYGRYLVPLRVTNSEPCTVVEEVECE